MTTAPFVDLGGRRSPAQIFVDSLTPAYPRIPPSGGTSPSWLLVIVGVFVLLLTMMAKLRMSLPLMNLVVGI